VTQFEDIQYHKSVWCNLFSPGVDISSEEWSTPSWPHDGKTT